MPRSLGPIVVPPVDHSARSDAKERQAKLTKPGGSLGLLEDLYVDLAGMKGRLDFPLTKRSVVVFAGDHGVAERGVSAYPQAVTVEMLRNFSLGGAAINSFARTSRAKLVVVNVGSKGPSGVFAGVQERRIGAGTRDISRGPAMSSEQALSSIEVGRKTVRGLVSEGLDILAVGEMGIGNTTLASAITAVCAGVDPALVTGPGTGLDEAGIEMKVAIIRRAIDENRPSPGRPVDVLQKVGGFEIGALVGAILEAASARVPVVLDGFITGSAALLACALQSRVRDYLIAGHLSPEPGHAVQLRLLRLVPLLDLKMRLGEGTGATLAFSIVEAACEAAQRMRTFSEAGVSTAISSREGSEGAQQEERRGRSL